jgi:hypothetical protein
MESAGFEEGTKPRSYSEYYGSRGIQVDDASDHASICMMSSPRNDYVVAVLLNQTLFPFVEPVLLTLPSKEELEEQVRQTEKGFDLKAQRRHNHFSATTSYSFRTCSSNSSFLEHLYRSGLLAPISTRDQTRRRLVLI